MDSNREWMITENELEKIQLIKVSNKQIDDLWTIAI